MERRRVPSGVAKNENELVCWGGEGDDGWTFHVILFQGEPRGEIRFVHSGGSTFTHPIGLKEIAMFRAERDDLLGPYVDDLIRQYRPH